MRETMEVVKAEFFDLAYDHVFGAVHADRTPQLTGPYNELDPVPDPFVMFAFLAAITERIQFTTGILVLPQRQTALVARQAADVDLLSGGRLRLGVGVGWNQVEYEALGQDFRTRVPGESNGDVHKPDLDVVGDESVNPDEVRVGPFCR